MTSSIKTLFGKTWHKKIIICVAVYIYANMCNLCTNLVHLNWIFLKHCTDQFRPQLHTTVQSPIWDRWVLMCRVPVFPAQFGNEAQQMEWAKRESERAERDRLKRLRQQEQEDLELAIALSKAEMSNAWPPSPQIHPFCTLQRRLCACVMDQDKILASGGQYLTVSTSILLCSCAGGRPMVCESANSFYMHCINLSDGVYSLFKVY